MKKYIVLILLLLMCQACQMSQGYLLEESFERDTTVFQNTKDSKTTFEAFQNDKKEGKYSICVTPNESGAYSYDSPTFNVSGNRLKISFWSKIEKVDIYNWCFGLKCGKDSVFSIMEGYTGSDNTVWGTYRYVNPDGAYRNLLKATDSWTYWIIDIDFVKGYCDVYINNSPVMINLPILILKDNLYFSFFGHSSKEQCHWYIDDFKIEEINDKSLTSEEKALKPIQINYKNINLSLDEGTGKILSLSFLKKEICQESCDLYKFENKNEAFWAREDEDTVKDIKKTNDSIVFSCYNPQLNINLTKTYKINTDNTVTKRVEFEEGDRKGFISWQSVIDLTDDFLSDSNPEGFAGADKLHKGDYTSALTKGYRVKSDNSYGIGIIRDRVNDRFVLSRGCDPYSKGFTMPIFSDYLEKKSSGQIRIIPFKGDFTNFIQYIYGREEYKALFSNPKAPWLKDLVCDAMYLQTSGINYEKAVVPLTVTDTIWFLNPPWGNWWADSDPPKSLHPNVKGISAERTSLSPNAKVSSYTNTLFDSNSDIYKLNDEDFFVINKDGKPVDGGVPSDSGGAKCYSLQILNPKVRQYWFDMHEDKLKGWQEHFFYMDGPGAYEELQDWKLMKVIQGYDWLAFYKELRGVIDKCASDGKGVFFTNGFQPYSDIGYIEYRDKQWQELAGDKWQYLAKTLLEIKLSQQKDYIVCPTYGSEGAQPTINTYAICYGWLGHLPNEKFIPWHKEALKYRDNEIIVNGVQNPWWREIDPQYEAYTFRNGKNIVLDVVNHSKDMEANISLNLKELGLSESKKYKVSIYKMNNPLTGGEEAMTLLSETVQKLRGKITVPLSDKGFLTSVVISQ